MSNSTIEQYTDLGQAYAYFNKMLFDNKLPDCLITLNRKAHSYGYYHHEKFQNRKDKKLMSEISLNPDGFNERDDLDILSTLAHEMVHVQQFYFGNPPRRGYHDREFSSLMFEIGLQTSSTGTPEGKSTGQRMSHYIINGKEFLNGHNTKGNYFWNKYYSKSIDITETHRGSSSLITSLLRNFSKQRFF